MNSLYGITGLKIKTIWAKTADELDDNVNAFLAEHNGNIVQIQTQAITEWDEVTIVYTEG